MLKTLLLVGAAAWGVKKWMDSNPRQRLGGASAGDGLAGASDDYSSYGSDGLQQRPATSAYAGIDDIDDGGSGTVRPNLPEYARNP